MRTLARILAAVALVLLAAAGPARADEIAPALLTLELRHKAGAELEKVVRGLSEADRRRLVGVYLAFDPTASDAIAMAACDDDGDYAVVLSDGMLRLADDVASAASYDEANGACSVERYARFFARSQLPGRRLLPPPAGSYSAERPGTTRDERLREALAFLVAREIAHLRAGDLVCPRPTATREHGDDVWTEAEQRAALESARTLYPGRAAERDAEAVARLFDAGRTAAGAEALLRFYAEVEAAGPRVATTYAALHPRAAARLEGVKAARRD